MPLYEYACEGCGELVELLIRGDEKPTCPDCGDGKLQRQLSVISAHVSSSGTQMPPARNTAMKATAKCVA